MEKMIKYAPEYLRRHLRRISVQIGNTSLGCWVLNDDELEASCKRHVVEYKFCIDRKFGCNIDMGYFCEVEEITEKSKSDNPVLCYILEELHKLGCKPYSIQYETGIEWTCDTNTEVFSELDEIIPYLARKFENERSRIRKKLDKAAEIERLSSTVKFRESPEYRRLSELQSDDSPIKF